MSNSIHISEQMDNITTIIFQHTADQMFTGVIDLTALNYKKNVGHLMRALLSTASSLAVQTAVRMGIRVFGGPPQHGGPGAHRARL